ncbi:MAG TPA: SMC-Scp complex subunit ScpB [Chromatiales bacterium]|nr:SMC-Scp complex subunit ScpB [Chromatiales bacterium]
MSSEKQIIEAALLAAGGPLSLDRMLTLFPEEERPDCKQLRALLEDIATDYEGRGIELSEVASGFRIQVRKEYALWVSRLWEERPPRYSRALLETLALIAYRQPITRGEIEDIRGVSVSSNIIKTLTEREWVRVVGHRDVPGKPALYATTREFLDYFGLKSLNELPSLAEIRDLDTINRELELREPEAPPLKMSADTFAGHEKQTLIEEVGAGDVQDKDNVIKMEPHLAARGKVVDADSTEEGEDLPGDVSANDQEDE